MQPKETQGRATDSASDQASRRAQRPKNPFDRLPIRMRLSLVAGGLTFVILLNFAIAEALVISNSYRDRFDQDMMVQATAITGQIELSGKKPISEEIAAKKKALEKTLEAVRSRQASARIVDLDGRPILAPTSDDLGPAVEGIRGFSGYRTASLPIKATGEDAALGYLQYARRLAPLEQEIDELSLYLLIGVGLGTGIAAISALILARRAMRPLGDLSKTARRIALTRDTTLDLPLISTEDEVGILADSFETMLDSLHDSQEALEASLERQRQFVADASHELRTPLTSVLVNLDLALVLQERGEVSKEEVVAALRSAKRMGLLVEDLLVLARTDAGARPELAEVDLENVIDEVVRDVAKEALEVRLELEESLLVEGSPGELYRLVSNLVANAHEHGASRLRIQSRRVGNEAVIDFVDDGPGIPLEFEEKIFERFVSAKGDQGSSTGLGLAIVKAIADRHFGQVRLVESASGAHFEVRLPLDLDALRQSVAA